MLNPPLPITKTLVTSTRFLAPAMAPEARYACADGAACVSRNFIDEEKVRACWMDFQPWLLFRALRGDEVAIEDVENSLDTDKIEREGFA